MKTSREIQNLVRGGRYEITAYADEEAQEDNVFPSDITNAILTGTVVKKYIDDSRGARYKILGNTLDGRELFVICRFNTIGEVRIITVFIKEKI
ncbi:MAG: DUF4258 domain-containing protein [Planctomycetota bacterium]